MSVEVDDAADLVKHLDPKLRRVGRRQTDPLDPLTGVALSSSAGHVRTLRPGPERQRRIRRMGRMG